jgi:hypothetical protein
MQTPSYFNNPKLDAQLMQWLREGHSHDDIIAQARHSWPEVPEEYLRTSLQIMVKVFQNAHPEPEETQHECLVFLRYLHNQRMKELDRLEKRLDDENCPMSVHTLYRGFIRDAEAYCLKMFTLERDFYFEARKADERVKKKQQEDEQRQRLVELLNHAAHNQSAEHKKPVVTPEPSKKQRNGQATAVMSFLLGCCLSLWWGQSGKLELAELYKPCHSMITAAHGYAAPCLHAYRSVNRTVSPSSKMLDGSGTETPISPGEPIFPGSPASSNVVTSKAAPKLTWVTMLPTESKINTPSPAELKTSPAPSNPPMVKPAAGLGFWTFIGIDHDLTVQLSGNSS